MRKKVALFGMLTALALIFSYIESLIPFHIGIPGIKLGLTNAIVIIALYKMGVKEAYALSVLRVILAGFLFGNLFSILYSLAGAILSLAGMTYLKYTRKFSIIGISVLGGVLHNIGQLAVAIILLENLSIAYYFAVLMISGLVAGVLVGIVSSEMLKRIRKLDL